MDYLMSDHIIIAYLKESWTNLDRMFRFTQPFYQGSISSTFYASFFCRYPFAKQITKPKCNRENLRKALLYIKCAHKMLMKLTPDGGFWYWENNKKRNFPFWIGTLPTLETGIKFKKLSSKHRVYQNYVQNI